MKCYLIMSRFLKVLLLVGVIVSGDRSSECDWAIENAGVTAGGNEGLKSTCRVRTLNPSLLEEGTGNTSLVALTHAHLITSLSLQCAHQVVFESVVKPGMFSPFIRLQELEILNCKVTEIPAFTFAGLNYLRKLTLNAHHENWPGASLLIDMNAFAEMQRLETLDLSYNSLWTMDASVLCKLPSLTSLNLTFNKFHHLPDLGFNNIGSEVTGRSHKICGISLQNLNVSFNQYVEVQDRVFSGAKSLRTLSISHNRIARLDDKAFESLDELRTLDLSFNRLVAIPMTALLDLRQLQELSLANNSLSVLSSAAFHSLSQLIILDLSHNQLSLGASSVDPFAGLIRLMVLDVSHNQLMHIGSETFKDLYSLQVLNLSNNKLSYVADFTFVGLSNLHSLNFSCNQMKSVSAQALQGLRVLTNINLDHNLLENIHDMTFDNCSSLQNINLSTNQLVSVPNALSRVQLLKTLDLSANQISYLDDGCFKGLSQLQDLRLSHNELANISLLALEDVPALKHLDLSNNSITILDHGILDVAPQLHSVDLQFNQLTNINGLVINLQKLLSLNVSHNMIQWFDYALIPQNLKWIDLSHNTLEKLDNYYEELIQKQLRLEIVYASHNNITEIKSNSFPDNIREIYLQHNVITYVASNTFIDKEIVSIIDLRNNNITLIEEAALRLSAKSKLSTVVYLASNPLMCDCGADWLVRAAGSGYSGAVNVNPHIPRLGDVTSVECHLPGLWDGVPVPLVTVQSHQFLCTYRRHCFTLCHCCDFDACDCEQTCPQNCTCYHDHTWTHNVVDCGGGWTQMPAGVPMDVTEAYLDGNVIGPLTSHALIGRKNLRVLHLNGSQVTMIQNRTFNGLKNLQVLHLGHNQIDALHGYEFVFLHSLRELYLQSNGLRFLNNITFSTLRSLELLRLDNNLLTTYPIWNLALNPFLVDVTLHDNQWSCECNFLANFRAWLEGNRIKTLNGNLIRCYHNVSGDLGSVVLSEKPVRCDHYVASTHINNLITDDYIMIGIISGVLLVILLSSFIIMLMCRQRIRLWNMCQYSKKLTSKTNAYIKETEKLFDVFITHSAKDSVWVCGTLAPKLESSGYKVCVVHRDCGSTSISQLGQSILDCINSSRRVVLVLSHGFEDAEWCRYEFKSAHLEALHNVPRRQIIVIKLEEILHPEIDLELHNLIRGAGTVLNESETKFWRILYKKLPPRRRNMTSRYCENLDEKVCSKPLVSYNTYQKTSGCHLVENGPMLNIPTQNSLMVNPCWQNAMVTNNHTSSWSARGPEMNGRTWASNTNRLRLSPESAAMHRGPYGHQDHTYMSVSELDDLSQSQSTSASSSLADSRSRPEESKSLKAVVPLSSVHGTSDYRTNSWIYRPSPNEEQPPPGQTYFV